MDGKEASPLAVVSRRHPYEPIVDADDDRALKRLRHEGRPCGADTRPHDGPLDRPPMQLEKAATRC
jgi:hypothetical protein